ncbi:hypothetical protein SGCOL_005380 [Colletotrichum sp. CLE4]
MGTRISSDGVEYQALNATSEVLAEISNTAVDFAGNLGKQIYWAPSEFYQPRKVYVYVIELDYIPDDIPQSRIELLKYPQYRPEELRGSNADSHGEKVINILASLGFGVARSKNIKIVPVRGTNAYPHDQRSSTEWKGALTAIANHFKEATMKGVCHGVLNCSRALERIGNIEAAFKECVDAGIIVVGAAGNRAVNLDESDKSKWPLPEAHKDTILIGNLDAQGNVYTEVNGNDGSSYGARVDYWVRGVNLKYKNLGPKPVQLRLA